MIANNRELQGAVEYVLRWADTLEAMRLDAEKSISGRDLLPTTSAGPVGEIRRVLSEVIDYLERQETQASKVVARPDASKRNKAA